MHTVDMRDISFCILNKNECAQHVSGITSISYTPDQKIGKPNNLKLWEQ